MLNFNFLLNIRQLLCVVTLKVYCKEVFILELHGNILN